MTVSVRDRPEQSRYEVYDDEALAGFSAYRLDGARMSFTHTETDEAFAGRGLGKELVRGALEDARGRGLSVLPLCPFVRTVIAEDEAWLDLVPSDERARFDLSG